MAGMTWVIRVTGVTHVAKVTRLTRVTGKNSEVEFHILGKETIDIVYEYTYLGTKISSTGGVEVQK